MTTDLHIEDCVKCKGPGIYMDEICDLCDGWGQYKVDGNGRFAGTLEAGNDN